MRAAPGADEGSDTGSGSELLPRPRPRLRPPALGLALGLGFAALAWASRARGAPRPGGLGAALIQERALGDSTRVSIDAAIRDFKRGHPDFEVNTEVVNGYDPHVATLGLVDRRLGPDGKPVFSSGITVQSRESFNQWFNDDPAVNRKEVIQLNLTQDAATGTLVADLPGFFPIDGKGWKDSTFGHNYWFTLEAHHAFVYHGGEVFGFRGDDDLWVFINNTLAIDLGGMHIPLAKEVRLDDLGLTKGAVASLDIFFAERHTVDSNFRIETTIQLGEDPCVLHPFVLLRTVTHNNLGGHGPGAGAEGLVYRGTSFEPGREAREVELHLNVKPGTRYNVVNHSHNGFHGHFGVVNVETGMEVTLILTAHDPHTKHQLQLGELSLTLFDLDTGVGGASTEYIDISGFSRKILMPRTEVVETVQASGKTRFSGSTPGTDYDNPHSPTSLTLMQKNRAVTLEFDNFNQIEFTLGMTAGSTSRDFLFDAKPSLRCAATEGSPDGGDGDNRPEVHTTTAAPAETTTSTAEVDGRCCMINISALSLKLVCVEERKWWTFWKFWC